MTNFRNKFLNKAFEEKQWEDWDCLPLEVKKFFEDRYAQLVDDIVNWKINSGFKLP